jgi:hypothetical protein
VLIHLNFPFRLASVLLTHPATPTTNLVKTLSTFSPRLPTSTKSTICTLLSLRPESHQAPARRTHYLPCKLLRRRPLDNILLSNVPEATSTKPGLISKLLVEVPLSLPLPSSLLWLATQIAHPVESSTTPKVDEHHPISPVFVH